MRPSASLAVRALSIAAAGFIAFATVMPEDAAARAGRGGSFGSRGGRTFDAPPATQTMPGAAPMQRSVTQPGSPSAGAPSSSTASQAGRSGGLFGGRFGGIGAGIMGGLLGAGLFGLLAGNGLFGGLGSMASIFGLILQIGIVFLVARFALKWWRNRQSPQPAAAGATSGGYNYDSNRGRPEPVPAGGLARTAHDGGPQPGPSGSSHYEYASRSGGYGSAHQYGRDEQGAVEISEQDFGAFERMLTEVQEAWTRQDLSRLRGLATPEMVEVFGEDLAEDASNGVINKVSGIKLLQGDLAESWSEGAREYATVAMRYELVDVTVERDSGRVVEGDETPTETSEMWTFLRAGQSGRWLLSAIQQAA